MKNWIRRIIGGLSFTTVLFVFQACYGTNRDYWDDIYVQGVVKSHTTNSPIEGIKVSLDNVPRYIYTDEEGKFSFYLSKTDTIKLKFEDIKLEDKKFKDFDTILVCDTSEYNNTNNFSRLNIFMEEN